MLSGGISVQSCTLWQEITSKPGFCRSRSYTSDDPLSCVFSDRFIRYLNRVALRRAALSTSRRRVGLSPAKARDTEDHHPQPTSTHLTAKVIKSEQKSFFVTLTLPPTPYWLYFEEAE
jgi:hypothetical protein